MKANFVLNYSVFDVKKKLNNLTIKNNRLSIVHIQRYKDS